MTHAHFIHVSIHTQSIHNIIIITVTVQKTIPSAKKIKVLSNVVMDKPSPILTYNSNKRLWMKN